MIINKTIDNNAIDIKELCICVLRKWRSIILAMMIGAALLCALEYLRQYQNLETADALNLTRLIEDGIAGALFGAFLVFAAELASLCTDSRLRSCQDLCSLHAVSLLGSVYVPACQKIEGKRFFIDRMIDKLAGESKIVDVDTQYALIAAKIPHLSNNKKIVLTGTVTSEVLVRTVDAIKPLVSSEYELCTVANPLCSADALNVLLGSSVILVEQVHCSQNKEIAELVNFFRDARIELIGSVAV